MINRILFYNSGGGIGDAIQLLPLIKSLKKEFKNSNFYYLCAHENHFDHSLKDLNFRINSIDLNVKYFGFRWWHLLMVRYLLKKKKIEKFDLIIDLQSKIRNSLILKMIPHKFFISSSFNFVLSSPKVKIKKDIKINKTILNIINELFSTNCILQDFNLSEINNKYIDESKRLLPKNNYVGFSITQGNIYRKKEWPLNNIVALCNKFKEKKMVPVFLIEKKNNYLKNKISKFIPNAIFPEHKSDLSSPALVTCLGKRLDFAISIDNGVMHMLSLSKTPMIVLFGPTSSEKFAPDYNNIIILDSKKIKKTSNISSITVEDVLKASEQLLKF